MRFKSSIYLGFILIAGPLSADDSFLEIKNLLSDRCYQCHGPDENTREAGLRLDQKDEAMSVIEAGDPDSSELFARIISDDESDIMPPPESKLELSDTEKELIRKWIEDGAQWQQHWAFEPLPQQVQIPQVQDRHWSSNEIDTFVLGKLEAQGKQPSKSAPAWQWLRRIAFDLTGLPPSPELIDSFSENDEHAYEKAIDQLLDSPSFGEHMAVAWLDAARYADSYGYQSDKLNTQWPYRDWVVQAFNENLPYDQFITWQLAGDLLDRPTREQRLATAFNRLHRLNNEGGAVFEEWRIENVADRVNTYGTAVLGLTVECARCHDHKFDPISSADYYSLFAFFNSIDENGLYDRTAKVPSPTMLLPSDEQQSKIEKNAATLRLRQRELEEALESADQRWRDWKNSAGKELVPAKPVLIHRIDRPFTNKDKQKYHPSTGDRGWTKEVPLVEVTDCSVPDVDENSAVRRAAELDGERGYAYEDIVPFDRWTPFSLVVTIKDGLRSPLRSLIAHHTRGTDAGHNGWDLTISNGYVESRMYRVWPGNALGVRSKAQLPKEQWCQLTATYDGSSTAQGLQIYLDGKRLELEILRDSALKSSNVNVDHGGKFVVGQRFRTRGFAGGLLDSVRLYDCELTPTEIQQLATRSPLEPSFEFFVNRIDDRVQAAMASRNEAVREFVLAEEACVEIPVMQELPEPRPAHILARGQYDAPRSDATRVERRTLDSIGPAFDDYPKNRLGLAQWTVHPNHPLTARVFMNRLWMNFFGRGLVETPEDFGVQSSRPTHPQLLDWLARKFVDSGWDIKSMCKRIALSSTYRQASAADESSLESDPENRWLGRGPAYRLSAEQIRDLSLAASGLLNPQLGGPPVSPYQPGGDLWKESNSMSPPYRQSVGVSLYRRSIYSVVKRTAPLPNMLAFDAGSREVCTINRSRTNTPLQAMVLMNDPQFVEAARKLAENQMQLQTPAARLNAMFKSLATRLPDQREREALLMLLQSELKHYTQNPEEARKRCAVGDTECDAALDEIELAAWTTVSQAILNLDATVWKR